MDSTRLFQPYLLALDVVWAYGYLLEYLEVYFQMSLGRHIGYEGIAQNLQKDVQTSQLEADNLVSR
jgi:hypothetical protein